MAIRISNPPSAFLLMDSLRSIGYSFNAAAADIVDNSISAQAKTIQLSVSPDPDDSYLGFLDDGLGMTRDELRTAMRYGSEGKEARRDPNDLGRFGMGLKSASLSQCKRLTVLSAKNGSISGAEWDLNLIQKTNDWTLQELSEEEMKGVPLYDDLRALPHGTLVLWRDFDVISASYNGLAHKGLIDCTMGAREYLRLVFHRFLASGQLSILLNGQALTPIDPFLEGHSRVEEKKTEDIVIPDMNGVPQHVFVTPFLLPYLKDLTDDDKERLGGIANINGNQGFYVYRNERLIIYGTWFRMTRREELSKYARIRVDIPSTLDDIWKIDIKKQNAELPPTIRRQLQKVVEDAKFSSLKKNEHRLTAKSADKSSIWARFLTRDQKTAYLINRDSPLVRNVFSRLSSEDALRVSRLLTCIEKAIPYHDFYVDEANDRIDDTVDDESREDILFSALEMFRDAKNTSAKSKEEIIEGICRSEPFCFYAWFKTAFLKELSHETE